jgi:hypothetical protein
MSREGITRLSGQLDTYASHDLHSFMMEGRENSVKNAKCAGAAQKKFLFPTTSPLSVTY